MNILFVSGGNNQKIGVPPFIKAQGDSIECEGIKVQHFSIIGKGVKGYLSNIKHLKKYLAENEDIDLIHAHFTLSAWVCVLAWPKQKIILSLMGTDAYGVYIGQNKVKLTSRVLTVLTLLIQPFVSKIISKSANIEKYVWQKHKSYVIPNGVDIDKFKPKEAYTKQQTVRITFLGNKEDPRKNFKLIEESLKLLGNNNLELYAPYPVKHSDVPTILNESDILVFPSFMEGSPNLVKEAMACNLPIVATDVGDIKWLFGNESGYFLANFTPENFAEKIQLAFDYSRHFGKTNGRGRIIKLGLDSQSVAQRVIELYKSLD